MAKRRLVIYNNITFIFADTIDDLPPYNRSIRKLDWQRTLYAYGP